MNNDKFQFLLIGHSRDDDSDFSENEYKNKDYKIQKYEKFKPKKNSFKKDLRGAENQIKNILSGFLKNIESEKRNSEIIFNDGQANKNKERLSISNRNKKLIIRKTSTFDKDKEDYIRSSSLSIPVKNNFLNNYLSKTPEISNHNPNIIHKKKITFNLNLNDISNASVQKEGSYLTSKKTKKKNNSLIKNNEIKVSKTLIFKEKINNFVKRTKSIGSGIFKRKNKNSKEMKGDLINSKLNCSKKSNLNKSNSLIKTRSFIQNNNNSYYNFKNDYFILNKSNNDNSINLKHSLKKKKVKFKSTKKSKIDLFNESTHNSIISDCSEYALNKKSIDIKSIHNESYINEKRNSVMGNSSLINRHLSTLLSKRGSIDNTEVSNKNSGTKSSNRPKKVSDFKKSIELKKKESNELKKWGTSIKDNQLTGNSKMRRLNTHFKSLKEQLKKSLILRPEELDLSSEERNDNDTHKKSSKKKLISNENFMNKFKKMSSFNYSFNNNMKAIKNKNVSKSNNNLLKINQSVSTNNLDTKTTSSNEKLKVENTPLAQEDKSDENLENQNTLKSKKSTFEDYSTKSIKRKNTMYYEKYRVLTNKASVYDSLDDEEFDDQEEINTIYIDPNSTFSIAFDSILFIMSILSLLHVPFYLAKEKNFCRNQKISLTFVINILIELINIIDLFLGFFRAFYNWEEQLINKNRIIIRKYLSGWFFFDLLASVPVYLIIKIYEPVCNENELYSSYYNEIIDKHQYLLISNRLFKALKVFNYNQAWKITSNKLNVYGNIIVYVFLIYAIFNYTTCLYIFIARNSYPNWILHSHLETHPFEDIYICGIYILIMALTTVGYGDITCYSMSERVFQLFLLVIGIMAYSWVVSLISNTIKKINERSADYENRKSILDEIKRTHPNLPDDLYERILRYLKFKNFHEKKLKNIVFDCLPVGLKNNLISEMYKPIIQNFIFFKNFQNTDFIVRVILSFKPILAYKNDILVNEGDLVEDIMFVKKGMLTVELPINMADPQENINRYINTSLIPTNNDKENQNLKNMLTNHDKDLKKNNSLFNYPSFLSYTSSMKNTSSFNPIRTQSEKEREEKELQELERKKNTTYVKILGIRENEHFGDVLMFLEQRSPLRVRVRSKKSELFFLKKMDAIKISASYHNIWRRINKKSVFNFEQMKKSIKNIVKVYCSVKKCKDKEECEESEEPSYLLGLNHNRKISQKDYLNNSALKTIKEETNLRKSQSIKIKKINYKNFFKNIEIDENELIIDNNNDNKKVYLSDNNDRLIRPKIKFTSSIKKPLALSSSSSESNSSLSPPSLNSSVSNSKSMRLSNFSSGFQKSKMKQKNNQETQQKFGQKVLDIFNGNYKFYKGSNQNANDQVTIITEQPDQEGTINPLNYTNSFQKIAKNSTMKKNNILNTITAKKSYYEEMPNCISENENEDDNNDSKIDNKSVKNKILTSKSMKKKLPSYNFNEKSKFDIIDQKEDSESDTYFENSINKEIYPGELIEVNKEENLLLKKIKLDSPTQENSELNFSFENKNNKLQLILRTIEDENENKTFKDKNEYNNYESIINEEQSSISGAGLSKFNSNKKLNSRKNNQESNRYIVSSLNQDEDREKSRWNIDILTIHYNISFHYNSSYENFNLISGEKLIKNKSLQNKMKNYLLEEIKNLQIEANIETKNSIIKKTNSFAGHLQNKAGRNLMTTTIRPDKRRSTSIIFNKNNNFHLTYKKTKKKARKTISSLHRRSRTANSLSEIINNSMILANDNNNNNYNNKEKPKKNINKFQTGIGNEVIYGLNNKMAKRRISCYKGIMANTGNNHLSNNISNVNIDNYNKPKTRKSSNVLAPSTTIKSRKKKDNILSQINLNIKKTNQNLNNPEEFYSNYFTSLLEEELNRKSQKNVLLFGKSMPDVSKVKKEKEKFSKLKGTIIK